MSVEVDDRSAVKDVVVQFRPGGLLRCCIEAILRHSAPGQAEGERLICPACRTEMVWRQAGGWQWPRSAEPLAKFLAGGERS